jgi:hypothetical protein
LSTSVKSVGTFTLCYHGHALDPSNPKKIILGFFSKIVIGDNQGSITLSIEQVLQKNKEAIEQGEESIEPNWKSKIDLDVFNKKWTTLVPGALYKVEAAIEAWSNNGGKGIFYKIMKADLIKPASPAANLNANSSNGFHKSDQDTFSELEHLVES